MSRRILPADLDAIVRKGDEIYERTILPVVAAADDDKFVAIDTRSGEFEMGDDDDAVTNRLRNRMPDAVIYIARVGHQAAYSMRPEAK